MLNFTGCTFYLLAKLIKHIKNSKHNFFNFLDNVLCKFFFTTACSVSTGYWLLTLGGPDVMPLSRSIMGTLFNIYVHGLIGVIMFIEVLIHKRDHHEHLYYKHLALVIGLGVVYFTTISLFAEFADVAIYPFLKLRMSIRIGVFIVLTILTFNSYQLYHFIVKNRFGNKDVDLYRLI
jgi:hypothetical protein